MRYTCEKRCREMLQKCSGLFLRCYSSSAAAAASSLLGTLRRRSGFPLMKCKEALTKHGNDLEAAEKWLQEEAQREGWAKVAKLEGRQAKQGLIGLLLDDNRAAMVEVNCETDFVARNNQFKALVSTITRETFASLLPKLLVSTSFASHDILTSTTILNIIRSGGATVGDSVAEMVGHFREKISVSRGSALSCTSGLLCGHIYNNRASGISDDVSVPTGPYGAVLHMNNCDSSSNPLSERDDLAKLRKLGEQVCQHIVGLAPNVVEDTAGENNSLVSQRFLFDDSVTVGELLEHNGVCVTRFVRYALGEKEENPWIGS